MSIKLADIPQVRTYINTYDGKESTLDALRLFDTGLSEKN